MGTTEPKPESPEDRSPKTSAGDVASDSKKGGDPVPAAEGGRLLAEVYDELRALAERRLAAEPPGQTLQATALVHEAWLKVGADREREWQGRSHFYATAAEAIRRLLIDRARRRGAARHGGGWLRIETVELSRIAEGSPDPDERLMALDAAVGRLAERDPAKAELVKLRYYAGLTIDEAARVLGISAPTAKRHWAYARAWLYREVTKSE